MLAGFLFMFFLERFFHFHHHDAPDDHVQLDEPPLAPAHARAALEHDRDHGHVHAKNASVFSMGGAAVGLTLHGLVDGVAMAAAVQAEQVDGSVALAGFGAFLAIALHKPFDSLTIGTLMAAGDRSAASRHLVNALYSLITPLGVALFYVFSARAGLDGLGQALGFAAGAFVCIATSDLLPELQFHRHDRAALSIALVAGIALAWSTVFLE
jgi:zinc and cadmium transporter